MTELDPAQPESGAQTPTAEEQRGADQPQHGQEPNGDEQSKPSPQVTSPTLEHLGETIKKAERAADDALAPQRDQH